MRNMLLGLLCGCLLSAAAAGCSGNTSDSSGDSASALVALQRVDGVAACQSQQAEIPSSGEVSRNIVASRDEAVRVTNDSVYVAYQVTAGDALLYLSFAPDLSASFSTDEARAAFKYAYIDFGLKQRAAIGGSLTLLSSSNVLKLSDFERFEVIAGSVAWRLVPTDTTHYVKPLSSYDSDPSNDPSPVESCIAGDYIGTCECAFTGPPTRVALEGTFPE